ncbi:MAG: hypothetical protein COA78_15115 [Blastopirellula sp.]|nr:MAG: hypothetical protein COA78_15115 [Blastopirellula sp.]
MFRSISLFLATLFLSLSVTQTALFADDLEVHKASLKWVDKFAKQQVLFSEADVKALRKRVEAMSEEESIEWWKKTHEHRELLDSEAWAATRAWLKELLKVQAKYTPEEIDHLQSEAFVKAQESPKSLKEVMEDLTKKRQSLVRSSANSAVARDQLLSINNAYAKDAVRQREAAMRARPKASSSAPAGPSNKPRTYKRYNQPIITSLDAARWSVLRNVYPGR